MYKTVSRVLFLIFAKESLIVQPKAIESKRLGVIDSHFSGLYPFDSHNWL